MKEVRISDTTLGACSSEEAKNAFTFREKIEAAKLLDRVGVSVIELGKMSGATADKLLIKSVAASVKDSVLAVCADFDEESVESVWNALKEAAHPRLQICAAVSTARMEYVYHKKADAMLLTAADAVRQCRALCPDVEFIAEDATRADFDFLCRILTEAIEAGAGTVTLCDTAGVMLPDEFAEFIGNVRERISLPESVCLGVSCSDDFHTADASAVAAIRAGVREIKASAMNGGGISLTGMAKLLSAKAEKLGVTYSVRTTEIQRVMTSIERLADKGESRSPFDDGVRRYPEDMAFTQNDGIEEIVKGIRFLGYDLDESDIMRIWKAFCKIARRKDSVSIGELEAIIASEAMQVPATYTLENFVVTTGNAIDIMAHVKLKRGEEVFDGLSIGDGPIDAAFLAIEKITGHHYELDDFQIQAITEGREAMGQTIVKLRSNGKVYSGRGISTDIIGSGVAAYVNALNKILYEEENP